MAQIPRAALDYLTKEINGISADAKAKVLRVLKELDWNDVPACRDAVVDVVNAVLDNYGLAAGQAAADFFDVAREIAVGEKLGATATADRDPAATECAIRAFVDKVNGGDHDAFERLVLSRIDYEIKRAAGTTMMENVARDPLSPRFARVPSGGETCKFCLMLAGRGFVYHSKKTAGEFGHYHDNCDCRIVPRFARVPSGGETCKFCLMLAGRGFVYHSKKTAGEFGHYHDNCDCRIVASWDKDGVEGYDPTAYHNEWLGRENFTIPEAKLTRYSLCMESERGRDKAIAFRDAEGYDPTAYHNEWLGRENFTIPEAKLTRYSLCMESERGRDKAIAFRDALGFTEEDAGEIMGQVYRWVGEEAKLTRYSLCMESERGRDKAIAFRDALGFTEEDAGEIMGQVYRWVGEHEPAFRESGKYGDSYTTDMVMVGKNGKTARVVVGWMKDHGKDKMRLTTIYVARRKG